MSLDDLLACNNCIHGEYHGYSKLADEMNYPVTIWFWCPKKEHHDSNHRACELHNYGDPKKIYDDVDDF